MKVKTAIRTPAAVLTLATLCLESAADEIQLDEMIVTATRSEKRVRDLGGRAAVLDANECAGAGLSLESLLSGELALDVQGGAFPGSESALMMRGLQGRYMTQRVLVMLDGRPLNDEYQGAADLRSILLDGVERVEVVRGPGSSLYGSDAMGGVVNVISRFGVPETVFRYGFGEDETRRQSVTHGNTLDRFRYQVTGTRVATQGYTTNPDGSHRDWDMLDLNARLGWPLGARAEMILSTGWQEHSGTREMFEDTQTRDFQDLIFTDGSGLELRVYRNALQRDLGWHFGFESHYDQSTEALRATKSIQTGAHELTFGAEYQEESANVQEASGQVDEALRTFATFLQDEMALGERISLTLGARYDRTSDFEGQLSPRAGVVYRPTDRTAVYVSLAKAFRAPAISDMYLPLTFFDGRWFAGSADVEPETMWSYEIGTRHAFNERFAAELTLFKSELHDAWDYMDDGGVLRPQNVTEISIWGVEASLKVQPLAQLAGHVDVAWADPTYSRFEPDPAIEGNVVEDSPRLRASAGVTYTAVNGVTAFLAARHTGARYTNPENTTDARLDSYTVADLRLKSAEWRGVSAFLTVSNIFDKRYQDYESRTEPGRRFFGGVTCRF